MSILNWFGKLMPYCLVEKMCKSFGREGTTLKIGNNEFQVKLIFTGSESGFWYSTKNELINEKRRLEEAIDKLNGKIKQLDNSIKKSDEL